LITEFTVGGVGGGRDAIERLSFKSKENITEKLKTTGLPPIKRFLYSHRATLIPYFFKMGKFHVGTCTSEHLSSSLESAPYIIPGSHSMFIKIIVKQKHGKEHHKILETITMKSHLLPMH
jgi:hypothetical protein